MASASPYGITVTWDKVYGARKYGVRSRYKGLTTWNENTAITNRIDNTYVIYFLLLPLLLYTKLISC